MTQGFLYSVYSKNFKIHKYFKDEFLVSLSSLKSVLPDCSVTLYTNILSINPDRYRNIDHIIYDQKMPTKHIAKAYGLLRSPYKKTIFLDCDTVVHRNTLNDVFDVLDEFDFACCYGNNYNKGEVFPDLNTGLIGVQKNNFTDHSIRQWTRGFWNDNMSSDQKHFRKIFINNKKRFYILPWWFQNRAEHFIRYRDNVVITHSRTMDKNLTIQNIKNNL